MARFAGDKKKGESVFAPFERWAVRTFTPRIPSWLETYHLTLLTLVWSAVIVFSGYLAHFSLNWLWLMSGMIVLQYVTDLFDGAVGRYRKTGLVKWGYFMDHFLDYVFICSILVGYAFIVEPAYWQWMFAIFATVTAYMVNAWLLFAATNEFRIAFWGVGPTEIRLVFIMLNCVMVFFGTAYFAWTLPLIFLALLVGLAFVVYNSQAQLWRQEMRR